MILTLSRTFFQAKQTPKYQLLNATIVGCLAASVYAPSRIAQLVGIGETPRDCTPHYIISGAAVLVFHRWLEVLSEKLPNQAYYSFWHWVAWISAPVAEIRVDESGRAVSPAPGYFVRRTKTFLKDMVLLIAVTSTYPFVSQMSSLAGVYWLAIYFSSFMSALSQGPGLMANLMGLEVVEGFHDPCFLSQGLNDFWGRRWNMAVHGFLRRVYFENVRAWTGSRALGTIAAFAGSAALHETLIWNLSLHLDTTQGGIARSGIGKHSLFFLSQAFLCYGERLLQRRFPGETAKVAQFPRPVQALLTAAVIVPFGHLFTGPLVENGLVGSLFAHTPHVRFD